MFFEIPWIISRRRVLIGSLLDCFINIFIYNYVFNKEIGSFPSQIVSIGLGLSWIIISYVLGRYIKISNITLISFAKAAIKIIFMLIFCNLIYLVINWFVPLTFYWDTSEFSSYLSRELSNLFIRVSTYIALLSLFLQYFFSIITYKIYNQKKAWIFYGTKDKYNEVIKEIGKTKKDLVLSWHSNQDNLEGINLQKTKGIIIGNLNDINKSNLDTILKLKLKGVEVEGLLSWFEKEFHRIPTNIIENKYQLIEKLKSIEDSYQLRTKRICDLLVSTFLVIITAPFFVIISILILAEDNGPIFYTQTRTGRNGDPFKIIKFRSMKIDAEKYGVQWSKKRDPRITSIGKIIRALRLDELPQLFCVIKGTMSLIGPRPERPEIENELLKNIPYYSCRNILRPGISGWAQVNYPYGASVSDTEKKLSFDIYYISHVSNLLDFLILFKTIKLVLNARGYKPNK